ncbi:MAG: FtsQ-type POTRA domain-containing protein [Ruminococcus sp.]|nr:FtsQ-type POTRA domain-containing protein [Candidatus Apopatosoma intestinale]
MKKRNKAVPERQRLSRTQVRITVFFAVATALVLVWFFALCRIGSITVEGNVHAEADKLTSAAGIETGTHIYAIDKGKIAARLAASSPYVSSVTVRRKLPKTLRLIVTEHRPAYYVEQNGVVLVLSPELSVLEIRDDAPSYDGTAHLLLSGTPDYTVGEPLFAESREDLDFIRGILGILEASDLAGSLTKVDLTEKFDVKILYKNLYTVVLGSYRDLESKLSLCIRTIRTLENDPNLQNQTGILYYLDEERTSFLPTDGIRDP